jgi:hypothetical protein
MFLMLHNVVKNLYLHTQKIQAFRHEECGPNVMANEAAFHLSGCVRSSKPNAVPSLKLAHWHSLTEGKPALSSDVINSDDMKRHRIKVKIINFYCVINAFIWKICQ